MNKVLVTGAAGFIGSAVVKECLEKDLEVFAIDVVENPYFRLPKHNNKLNYFQKNLKNIDELEQIFLKKLFHFISL